MFKELVTTALLSTAIGTQPLAIEVDGNIDDANVNGNTIEIHNSTFEFETRSFVAFWDGNSSTPRMGYGILDVKMSYSMSLYNYVPSNGKSYRIYYVDCLCYLRGQYDGTSYTTQANEYVKTFIIGNENFGYQFGYTDMLNNGNLVFNNLFPRIFATIGYDNACFEGEIQSPTRADSHLEMICTQDLPFYSVSNYTYDYAHNNDEVKTEFLLALRNHYDKTMKVFKDTYQWVSQADNYETGYHDGYLDGEYNATAVGGGINTAFDAFGKVVGCCRDILDLRIFPGVTLGLVFSIPIMFIIIVAIFRIAKG